MCRGPVCRETGANDARELRAAGGRIYSVRRYCEVGSFFRLIAAEIDHVGIFGIDRDRKIDRDLVDFVQVFAGGAPREVHGLALGLFDQNSPVTRGITVDVDSKFIRPMATAPLGLVASLITV